MASRSAILRKRVDVMAGFTASGNPSLVANFAPNGGLAKPRWSICPPAHPTTCASAGVHDQFFQPGPTPAGTVFEASVRYRGKSYVTRTATWSGTVHATSLPQLSGMPSYGHAVVAHAGRWAGGWQAIPGYRYPKYDSSAGRAPSSDVLNIEACRTPTGHECVNLTPQGAEVFEKRPAVVGSALTGRYLFAFDERFPPDVAIAGVGYDNAASIPPVKTGPTTTRSAPLGPISGPAPPRVTLFHRALAHHGRVRGRTRALLGALSRLRPGARPPIGQHRQPLADRHPSDHRPPPKNDQRPVDD